MRMRFAGYLAIGVVSAFLIVASYAFVADTFWWIALIGVAMIATAGLSVVGLTEHELLVERDVRHPGMPAIP